MLVNWIAVPPLIGFLGIGAASLSANPSPSLSIN